MNGTYSLRERILHRLQRHNPFYFISAACMLAGILAVTNSMSWTSIPLGRLLVLIATLNIYEVALIALACFLIRYRNLGRDAAMLLVLEAFFLIDITFLNAEIVTSHLALGTAINLVLFVAAVAKLAAAVRLMGHSVRDGRFAALVMQVAALFALPIVLRSVDHGAVSDKVFYAVWWVIGLMIPLSQEMCRRSERLVPGVRGKKTLALYLALPWLSMVMHAGIMHYVYGVQFYAAETTPLLLGLTFVVHGVKSTKLMPRSDLALLKVLLPLAALVASANDTPALYFAITQHGHLHVTPIQLAAAGAYLTYVILFFRAYTAFFVAAGLAAIPIFMFGPTLHQTVNAEERLWDQAWSLAGSIAPKTALDWGVDSIAAAFAFLGLGVFISLRQQRIAPPAPAVSDN